jgi:hypothetical protein
MFRASIEHGDGNAAEAGKQQDLWIAAKDVAATPGNAFYDPLNQILDTHKFDSEVEHLCRKFYKKSRYGRPSLTPGVYYRCLLIGFRRTGFGTRDRLADGRLLVVTQVPGLHAGGGDTGSFHDFAHPAS